MHGAINSALFTDWAMFREYSSSNFIWPIVWCWFVGLTWLSRVLGVVGMIADHGLPQQTDSVSNS